MSATAAPPGTDAALWAEGQALRRAHRPVGGSTVCPTCRRPWQCGPYLAAVALLREAQRPARAVGVAPVGRPRRRPGRHRAEP